MTLVEPDSVDHALDRLVDGRVLEHDVGGLAAEFQGEAGAGRRGDPADLPTDLGRPGERHLVDPGVAGERRAGAPAPVTMLTTPGGSSASAMISPSARAVSEVVSAGLSTTVLPQASAGAIFHAAIISGKFHGMI